MRERVWALAGRESPRSIQGPARDAAQAIAFTIQARRDAAEAAAAATSDAKFTREVAEENYAWATDRVNALADELTTRWWVRARWSLRRGRE